MDPILIIVPVIRYEVLSESKNKIKNQYSLKWTTNAVCHKNFW